MRWCFHGLQSLIGLRAMILSRLTLVFTACRLSYSLLTEEKRANYYRRFGLFSARLDLVQLALPLRGFVRLADLAVELRQSAEDVSEG